MSSAEANRDRIQPWTENPFYWQYKERPVLLLGGSVEDNLFQIDNLREHLDLLVSVGGNYVRCTMSSRDPGDVWPFQRDDTSGLYDLEKPGVEYWRRFEQFLKLTAERDIIVQIEVWDRFDYTREPWRDNPLNPKNNVNYTSEQSGLPHEINTHPAERESCFFRSVPALENNELLLRHQHKHVDRLLELSLPHGHVLYCMDNETNESHEWGFYWIRYIRAKAKAAGVEVQTTEMWDAWDLHHEHHGHSVNNPDLATFLDFSQNNQQEDERHYRNFLDARQMVVDSGAIRPINTVKTYGAHAGHHGSGREGIERFWRSIFGGAAAARFHRPPAGHGLGDIAQAHLRSARRVTDEIDALRCEPRTELLAGRSRNEAFCLARPGDVYAVFFTDGGQVRLKCDRPATVKWLNCWLGAWQDEHAVDPVEGMIQLRTPDTWGYWVGVVRERHEGT